MIERIVFLQDSSAAEAMTVLRQQGAESAVDFLAQWDNGNCGDIHPESAAGSHDTVYKAHDGYTLIYNLPLYYIGLERQCD